jgi:hypothetical protein
VPGEFTGLKCFRQEGCFDYFGAQVSESVGMANGIYSGKKACFGGEMGEMRTTLRHRTRPSLLKKPAFLQALSLQQTAVHKIPARIHPFSSNKPTSGKNPLKSLYFSRNLLPDSPFC